MANLTQINYEDGFDRIQKHMQNEAVGRYGAERKEDVADTLYKSVLPEAIEYIGAAKFGGTVKDKKSGKEVEFSQNPNYTLGFGLGKALKIERLKDESLPAYEGRVINTVFKGIGIDTSRDSLEKLSQRLIGEGLDAAKFREEAIELSPQVKFIGNDSVSYNTPANAPISADLYRTYRWAVPEVFLSVVRAHYQHQSRSGRWIFGTRSVDRRSGTVPYIKRGNAKMKHVPEGTDIPLGGFTLDQTTYNVKKYGIGIEMTDEAVQEFSIDALALFGAEKANEWAIMKDYFHYTNLVEGSLDNGDFAAPTVGVANTTTGITYTDIKNVVARMASLNYAPNQIISGEAEMTKDLYAGTDRDETLLMQYMDKLSFLTQTTANPNLYELGATNAKQILFLDNRRCLQELTFMGTVVEPDRKAKNQTNTFYMSEHLGSHKMLKEAAIVLDGDVVFNANQLPNIGGLLTSPFE